MDFTRFRFSPRLFPQPSPAAGPGVGAASREAADKEALQAALERERGGSCCGGGTGEFSLQAAAAVAAAAGGPHHGGDEAEADDGKLRELEQFAANFKSRRIKLGYTQTNVGKCWIKLKTPEGTRP